MIDVLVVDDEPLMREIAQDYLEMEGDIMAKTASSAEEAIDLLTAWRYDAVICDYHLQGGSGVDLLRALRTKGDDIPFILFTGQGREEIEMQTFSYGPCYCVHKGTNQDEGLPELRRLIVEVAGSGLRSEKRRQREEHISAILSAQSEFDHDVEMDIPDDPLPEWMKSRRPIEGEVEEGGFLHVALPYFAAKPGRILESGARSDRVQVLDLSHRSPSGPGTAHRFTGGLKVVESEEGIMEASDLDQEPRNLRSLNRK